MEDALKSSLWGPWSRVGLQAALATLVVDQAQKWWMIKGVGLPECVRERCITITVTPFLDLKYVRNTGISYSLLDQKTMTGQYVLAIFALIASVALWNLAGAQRHRTIDGGKFWSDYRGRRRQLDLIWRLYWVELPISSPCTSAASIGTSST